MKIVNVNSGIAFQGDIAITPVDSLPENAVKAGDNVVAHSETGHNHVVEGAEVFTVPGGMELYFRALGKSTVDLVHHRPHDTHEQIRFESTNPNQIWRVRRQREFTPAGWRRVED